MKPEDIRYFDIHSHLNFPQFDADREAIIAEMATERIATITVGTQIATSSQAIDLAKKHAHLFAAVGVHPLDVERSLEELALLINHEKVVAVGECGLDYSRSPAADERETQRRVFVEQIELAVAADKPLIIHCRDAYLDALAILAAKKKEVGDRLRGDFHFFTSPVEIAKKCLDLGFYISFTGPITFTHQYEDIVAYVPLEKMMVETDAPYAAPFSHRGKRNSPLFVGEIAAAVAAVKNQDIDSVAKTLVQNTFTLFFRKNAAKF